MDKNKSIDWLMGHLDTPEGTNFLHIAMKNDDNPKFKILARLLRGEIDDEEADRQLTEIQMNENHDDTDWLSRTAPHGRSSHTKKENKYWLAVYEFNEGFY